MRRQFSGLNLLSRLPRYSPGLDYQPVSLAELACFPVLAGTPSRVISRTVVCRIAPAVPNCVLDCFAALHLSLGASATTGARTPTTSPATYATATTSAGTPATAASSITTAETSDHPYPPFSRESDSVRSAYLRARLPLNGYTIFKSVICMIQPRGFVWPTWIIRIVQSTLSISNRLTGRLI